ncbi:MAG: SdpI family protein [Thermotogaceae bacterium]|nr:SdpI family protein [Thermotogaceae bacterium]
MNNKGNSPTKKLRKSEITVFIIVLFAFIVSVCFYSKVPEKMASHWSAKGEVDGYTSKFFGLFFLPFVFAGLALLFVLIPKIDPLKENIEKFRKYYDGFIILFSIYMVAMHFQIILWNVGIKINPGVFIAIGMGVLLFYIGILCENSKRNWFIGIRTPWTLSSEIVWEKTHKIGGKLFKIAGIITFIGAFFPNWAVLFIIIPVISVTIYVIVYSYFEYQKEKK